MKKENKKGSHISLVLSFIIFVVSLIFVYIIASASISPPSSKKGILFGVEGNLVKEISGDVWVIRFNDESSLCIQINKPDSLEGNSIAISDQGSIESSVSEEGIFVEGGHGFVKVYYSSHLKNVNGFSGGGCTLIEPDSVKKENLLLETKIYELISNFSSNYSLLKEKLKIPDSSEFNLFFVYSNGSTIGDFGPDPETSIYLKEMNLEYLSSSSRYETGKLVVKLW